MFLLTGRNLLAWFGASATMNTWLLAQVMKTLSLSLFIFHRAVFLFPYLSFSSHTYWHLNVSFWQTAILHLQAISTFFFSFSLFFYLQGVLSCTIKSNMWLLQFSSLVHWIFFIESTQRQMLTHIHNIQNHPCSPNLSTHMPPTNLKICPGLNSDCRLSVVWCNIGLIKLFTGSSSAAPWLRCYAQSHA